MVFEGSSIDYLAMIGTGGEASIVEEEERALPHERDDGNLNEEGEENQQKTSDQSLSEPQQHQSVQYTVRDLPSELQWMTDSHVLKEEITYKKEQLIVQEKQLNECLQDFYENLQLVVYEFLPREKFQLLEFDFSAQKETWQTKYGHFFCFA